MRIVYALPDHPEPLRYLQAMGDRLAAFAGKRGGFWYVPRGGGLAEVYLDVPADERVYYDMLGALCKINVWTLRRMKLPALYASRVKYQREPPRHELWQSSWPLYRAGEGDCDDLACHRVAELRLSGVKAKPMLTKREDARGRHYHVVVEIPEQNRIEDPSCRLGMSKGRCERTGDLRNAKFGNGVIVRRAGSVLT